MTQRILPPSAPALASRRLPLIGEDEIYAKSRKALLAEEIDLRRRLAHVAEIRRALPPGPLLSEYRFNDMDGKARLLSDLFGSQDTLILYACDFGNLGPSPLCYHFLAALQGNIDALRSRAEFAVISVVPAKDVQRFAELHQWQSLNAHDILDDHFLTDMHLIGERDQILGTLFVCRKTADGIRLFWKSEITEEMADPGESPRDMFELASLWALLDLTPIGRAPPAAPDRDLFRRPWDHGLDETASGRWPRPVYGIA